MRTQEFIETYSGLLAQIIADSTEAYDNRAISLIQRDKMAFTSLPHTNDAKLAPNERMVDVLYIDVKVNLDIARMYSPMIREIMSNYPHKKALADGIDPVKFARSCGLDKYETYQLLALGAQIGVWKLVTPRSSFSSISREEAISRYESKGFFYISGDVALPIPKPKRKIVA